MTLEILTSDDLLPFRHGFFTRRGGISSGIFSSLNCGPGSSDQSDAVRTNRRLVAQSFDLPEDKLVTVHQTHSADVLVVDGPIHSPRPECDAMVSNTRGLALGILTADCQPVLFSAPYSGVVGAAHAGWKGALGGVLEATLDKMESLGADRKDIRAVIGPTIGPDAYEVGPEFRDQFLDVDPGYSKFFKGGDGDRLMFDLPSFGLQKLRDAGIGSASWTGNCTYSDATRFYSYRRTTHAAEADYGRLISVIAT